MKPESFVDQWDYDYFMRVLHHHEDHLKEGEADLLSMLAGSWAVGNQPVKVEALRRGRRIASRVAAAVRQNKEVK